jgi:hypothetical protein
VVEALVCNVCGEPGDEQTLSICSSCGDRFHLNQRNDLPGKDCGAVWINEQFLSLEFACQRCLAGEAPAPEKPAPQVLRPRIGRRRFKKRT